MSKNRIPIFLEIISKLCLCNSKEKFVVVGHEQRISYDRLFLLCGLQFDYPIKLQNPPEQTRNVAFVNNSMEAESLLVKVNELGRRADNCWFNLCIVSCVFHVV